MGTLHMVSELIDLSGKPCFPNYDGTGNLRPWFYQSERLAGVDSYLLEESTKSRKVMDTHD
ncbi:hypothetical protein LINGRAHAP2_LOCUS4627 [Linum grandiflorum]